MYYKLSGMLVCGFLSSYVLATDSFTGDQIRRAGAHAVYAPIPGDETGRPDDILDKMKQPGVPDGSWPEQLRYIQYRAAVTAFAEKNNLPKPGEKPNGGRIILPPLRVGSELELDERNHGPLSPMKINIMGRRGSSIVFEIGAAAEVKGDENGGRSSSCRSTPSPRLSRQSSSCFVGGSQA